MAPDWEMVPDGTNPCRSYQGVEKREENREVAWRVAMKGRNEVFLRCLLPSKFGKYRLSSFMLAYGAGCADRHHPRGCHRDAGTGTKGDWS